MSSDGFMVAEDTALLAIHPTDCGFDRGIVRPLLGKLHVLKHIHADAGLSEHVENGNQWTGRSIPGKPCRTPAFSTVRRCLSTAALPPFRLTLGEFHGGQNRLAVVVWFPLTVSLASQPFAMSGQFSYYERHSHEKARSKCGFGAGF